MNQQLGDHPAYLYAVSNCSLVILDPKTATVVKTLYSITYCEPDARNILSASIDMKNKQLMFHFQLTGHKYKQLLAFIDMDTGKVAKEFYLTESIQSVRKTSSSERITGLSHEALFKVDQRSGVERTITLFNPSLIELDSDQAAVDNRKNLYYFVQTSSEGSNITSVDVVDEAVENSVTIRTTEKETVNDLKFLMFAEKSNILFGFSKGKFWKVDSHTGELSAMFDMKYTPLQSAGIDQRNERVSLIAYDQNKTYYLVTISLHHWKIENEIPLPNQQDIPQALMYHSVEHL